MKIRTTKYAAILGTAITLAVPGIINAQTVYTWNGLGDASTYQDGSNWDLTTAPTSDLTSAIATFTGGTVDLSATQQVSGLDFNTGSTLSGTGSIEIGTSGIEVNGNSTLNTAGLVLNEANTTITFDGGRLSWGNSLTASGTGALTVTGNNVLFVDGGANTYQGGTTITGGASIGLKNGDALGTGNLTIDNGTLFTNTSNWAFDETITVNAGGGTINGTNRSITLNSTAVISGPGAVTFKASDTADRIKINSVNTYLGGTTIDTTKAWMGGVDNGNGAFSTGDITLQNFGIIKNSNNHPTVSNNVIIDSTGGGLEAGWGKSLTINGVISGDGQLTITGDSGELRINNNANSYTGGTRIIGNLVIFGGNNHLGTGPITFEGGSFMRNNNSNSDLSQDVILESGVAEVNVGWTGRRIAFNGVVSGAGGLLASDNSSSVNLGNTNTYSGGTEIQGFVQASTGGLGTGDITLNAVTAGRGRLKNNNTGVTTLSNNLIISANGGRMQAGWNNDLIVTGVVSGAWPNTLTIEGDSGTAILSNSANTFGGNIVLEAANSKLRVASLESGNYQGNITGAGEIDFDIGSGTQIISVNPTHTGVTTISSGTVSFNYSGAFASDSSMLNDTVALNLGGTIDLTGDLPGIPTAHDEIVASTTLLAGKASGVTVSGTHTGKLLMGAITRESGASIDFGASNIATTTNTNTNGILGPWATVAGTDFAANDGSGNIIAFAGYTDVTRLDGGTQVISDGATTQVRIVEGTGTAADITLGAPLTTIDTLNQSLIDGSSAATVDLTAGALAVNTILVGTGAGDLTLNNGTLQSAGTDLVAINDSSMTVNSVIADGTGASDLSKSGAGQLTLTANNTYTGNTTVNEGTLKLQGAAFSNGTRTYSIASGATLNVDGGHALAASSNTTINGAGTFLLTGGSFERSTNNGATVNMELGSGALIDIQSGATLQNGGWNALNWTNNLADVNVAGTLDVWDGNNDVRVDALTGDGLVTIGNTGTAADTEILFVGVDGGSGTFTGTIENPTARIFNLVKAGAGTQTLTGLNTHNGSTTVTGGTLAITENLGLQNSAIDTSGAGQITLTGTTPTFGGLIGSGDLTSVISNYASVTALTLNPEAGASNSYSAAVTDGSAPMTLTKTGDGSQTLSGDNTYTGGTTVNAGTLVLSGNNADTAAMTVNGGTLRLEGDFGTVDFAVASPGTLDINTTAGTRQINGGTISGDGTLVKSGSGLLMFGANGSTQNISMTGGLIDVQAGTLRNEYGVGDWSANLSSLNIEAEAIVDTWDGGNIRVDALTGAGTVTHTSYGAPTTITVGVNGGSGTFSGVLTDDVSRVLGLVKEGAGTQTLSGVNTYTGATTVSAGTLELAAGSLTSAITVSSGASLGFVIDSSITSTASVDLVSGSTISISGTPTLASYTLITASAITGTAVLDSPIAGYELNQTATTLTLDSTAAPADDYSTWAAANGITGEPATGDFENDGLSNLLEYALGKNPIASDGPAETSFDGMTVVYTKGADAIDNADVSWAIEESDDLGDVDPWTPVVTQAAGNTDLTIEHTLPTQTKVFVRLKVTEVAP